jgi:hypothetical protein
MFVVELIIDCLLRFIHGNKNRLFVALCVGVTVGLYRNIFASCNLAFWLALFIAEVSCLLSNMLSNIIDCSTNSILRICYHESRYKL